MNKFIKYNNNEEEIVDIIFNNLMKLISDNIYETIYKIDSNQNQNQNQKSKSKSKSKSKI